MEAPAHGRCVDPEHSARLIRAKTEPLDEDHCFQLPAGELFERSADVMARRHGSAEILSRNRCEDPASADGELA